MFFAIGILIGLFLVANAENLMVLLYLLTIIVCPLVFVMAYMWVTNG